LTGPADAWLDPGRPVPHLRTELPGPQARLVLERDAAVTSPSLPRAYPMVPRRGTGSLIEDVDGNLFLDFNAGIAVCSTGHAHPRVVEAVRRQAGELLHYSASDFYLPIYSQLCEALAATAPLRGPVRAFLTNSGTEAVEGALKLARAATGRQYAISFHGAFHGRSYGSVSLTASKATYHAGFGPLLPGVLHALYGYCHRCPLNLTFPSCNHATVDWLEDTLFRYEVDPAEVAAVFVEPIQGEGGYIVPPPGWMDRVAKIAKDHDLLLIDDEVQTGLGRTGKMWAIEHSKAVPDILTMAKSIASGVPMGAAVYRADMDFKESGKHSNTFGGNPIASAASLATLDVIEDEDLVARSAKLGEHMAKRLDEMTDRYAFIGDRRGLGMMQATEFVSDKRSKKADPARRDRIEKDAYEHGLILLPVRAFPHQVSRPDRRRCPTVATTSASSGPTTALRKPWARPLSRSDSIIGSGIQRGLAVEEPLMVALHFLPKVIRVIRLPEPRGLSLGHRWGGRGGPVCWGKGALLHRGHGSVSSCPCAPTSPEGSRGEQGLGQCAMQRG